MRRRLIRSILTYTVSVLCMATTPAGAESARTLHDISHLSVGFTANTVAYPLLRHVGGLDKTDAWLLSLGLVAAAAVGKELLIDRRGSVRDAALGITGAVTSGITILAIEIGGD